MSVKFAPGVQDVVKSLRNDANATNWVVVGYGAGNEIVVEGSGAGGIEELRAHLDETKIQYALLRVSDVVDGNATTKFVWIVWLGEKAKTIAKGRVTPHRGDIKDQFGQAHVTIDAANLSEVTEDIIMAKVSDASGSSVRVLKGEQAGDRAAADRTVHASNKVSASALDFADRDAQKAELAAVRTGTGGRNWVLLGYDGDSNVIVLKGSGNGGASELAQLLTESSIAYGLVRVPILVDNNEVARFALVVYVGNSVSSMRKAKIVTHKGQILEHIGQYHVDLSASEVGEVSTEAVLDLVNRTAGVIDHSAKVSAAAAAANSSSTAAAAAAPSSVSPRPAASKYSSPGASLISNPKKGNAVNTTSVQIDFEDADGIKRAIAGVRADDNPNDWLLIGYTGDRSLKLLGTGTGGPDSLARHIDNPDEGAYYGYLRIPTVVDGTSTVKFVFIIYQGDRIKVVRKAKIATHTGAMQDFVGQFHLKLEFNSTNPVSADAITKAVNNTTGEGTGSKK